jgi:hypothetical protein
MYRGQLWWLRTYGRIAFWGQLNELRLIFVSIYKRIIGSNEREQYVQPLLKAI